MPEKPLMRLFYCLLKTPACNCLPSCSCLSVVTFLQLPTYSALAITLGWNLTSPLSLCTPTLALPPPASSLNKYWTQVITSDKTCLFKRDFCGLLHKEQMACAGYTVNVTHNCYRIPQMCKHT